MFQVFLVAGPLGNLVWVFLQYSVAVEAGEQGIEMDRFRVVAQFGVITELDGFRNFLNCRCRGLWCDRSFFWFTISKCFQRCGQSWMVAGHEAFAG